jgi:hypothetical protein
MARRDSAQNFGIEVPQGFPCVILSVGPSVGPSLHHVPQGGEDGGPLQRVSDVGKCVGGHPHAARHGQVEDLVRVLQVHIVGGLDTHIVGTLWCGVLVFGAMAMEWHHWSNLNEN